MTWEQDANHIFEAAGLPVQGNEYLYSKVIEALGEKRAAMSVFNNRPISNWQSQIDSLIEELKAFKTMSPEMQKEVIDSMH